METKYINGTGIVGNKVVINIVDMAVLSMAADRIEAVIENHKNVKEYDALPNEMRDRLKGPEKIEVSDTDLTDIAVFLRKCAGSFAKSKVFDAEDDSEVPEEEGYLQPAPEYALSE